jgi:hypothetical protein
VHLFTIYAKYWWLFHQARRKRLSRLAPLLTRPKSNSNRGYISCVEETSFVARERAKPRKTALQQSLLHFRTPAYFIPTGSKEQAARKFPNRPASSPERPPASSSPRLRQRYSSDGRPLHVCAAHFDHRRSSPRCASSNPASAAAANPSVVRNLFMAPRPNATGGIAAPSVAPRTAAAKHPASAAADDGARRPKATATLTVVVASAAPQFRPPQAPRPIVPPLAPSTFQPWRNKCDAWSMRGKLLWRRRG